MNSLLKERQQKLIKNIQSEYTQKDKEVLRRQEKLQVKKKNKGATPTMNETTNS
jgi:hypothetical protein